MTFPKAASPNTAMLGISINITRCMKGDEAEWRHAAAVQALINDDLAEYVGYGAGVASYKLTYKGTNARAAVFARLKATAPAWKN